jgi:hypothetical protein
VVYAERPVPPYIVPIEVVAETTPLLAWSGPFKLPMVTVELKVFEPEKVLLVVVLKAVLKAPVPLSYASGYWAESEVEEILLLKVVQSVEERRPRAEAEAVGRLKVRVLAAPVTLKSVPVVEVASRTAPLVTCWPVGPMAVKVPPAAIPKDDVETSS